MSDILDAILARKVEEVRERLAKALPEVVNEATPDGRIPDDNQLGGILDKLGKFLR